MQHVCPKDFDMAEGEFDMYFCAGGGAIFSFDKSRSLDVLMAKGRGVRKNSQVQKGLQKNERKKIRKTS